MGKTILDCLAPTFQARFGDELPREITPRVAKDLRTELNRTALRILGHKFPKEVLGRAIEQYLTLTGYKKEFIKDYQRLSRPQWVYTKG